MPESLLRVISIGLALTFAWAALSKVTGWSQWRATLSAYGFTGPVGAVAAIAVPACEVAVPTLLIAGSTRAGAVLVVVLVLAFSVTILRASRASGTRLPCGCFGGKKERDYRVLLARNAALGLGAALVSSSDQALLKIGGLETPAGAGLLPMALTLVGIALIAALVGVAARHL